MSRNECCCRRSRGRVQVEPKRNPAGLVGALLGSWGPTDRAGRDRRDAAVMRGAGRMSGSSHSAPRLRTVARAGPGSSRFSPGAMSLPATSHGPHEAEATREHCEVRVFHSKGRGTNSVDDQGLGRIVSDRFQPRSCRVTFDLRVRCTLNCVGPDHVDVCSPRSGRILPSSRPTNSQNSSTQTAPKLWPGDTTMRRRRRCSNQSGDSVEVHTLITSSPTALQRAFVSLTRSNKL